MRQRRVAMPGRLAPRFCQCHPHREHVETGRGYNVIKSARSMVPRDAVSIASHERLPRVVG